MSDINCNYNNYYQADTYSSQFAFKNSSYKKGKIMNKHNRTVISNKIIQYKKKNNIDADKRISSYDVYKSGFDKKNKHSYVKSFRLCGNDYKEFTTSNELPSEFDIQDETFSAYESMSDYYYYYDHTDNDNDSDHNRDYDCYCRCYE